MPFTMGEAPQAPSYNYGLGAIHTTPNVEAQIQVGPPAPPPDFQEFLDYAPYVMYQVKTNAVWDNGLAHMPGTGVGPDGEKGEVVKVHGGKLTLVTTWVVGRPGKPPVLPAFHTRWPNIVPLKASIVAEEVMPSADGMSLIYMTAGVYTHAVLDPRLFQMVGTTPVYFAPQIQAGARLGHTAWVDNLFEQAGIAGANPFLLGRYALNPDPALPQGYTYTVPTLPGEDPANPVDPPNGLMQQAAPPGLPVVRA